ncbi:2-dehydropantoate 2-reductase [Mangrovimicrobium sediminis]|uniref:2-dehydropantoate 2-reductase n=1 Tax=Mangrovimicrobium sediminis TaxID=2562682 RepID=A0A4Z0M3L6_9GAMM|nr:2-dehydropantoate 2-reductase [Haliea sp. SAOS-164]TGD74037.1 2-dehydropantoate 2-reductase [Haliea sp. SAOS-164]
MSGRHWHILGAGAMGCLFARMLQGTGCEVTLLFREKPTDATGTIVVEEGESIVEVPVALSANADSGAIDYLVVCTKAYEIAGAIGQVAHRINGKTQIVIAANGMGYLEDAQRASGEATLFCCTTTEGAYRTAPLHVRHAGRGRTLLGKPGGGEAPLWMEDWTNSPLAAQWEGAIEAALWHKLAINCAINPLTAVHRCLNGELADRPVLRQQVDALCAEIAGISRAAGFHKTAHNIHTDALLVIASTAQNRSSMLQDTLAGRRTEIDYITGHLLAVAAAWGVDAPRHEDLYRRVLAISNVPV